MLASALISLLALPSSNDYASLFIKWKYAHGKSYAHAAAERKAFATFCTNDDIIAKHNAKQLSYTLDHNEFSDLTADEVRRALAPVPCPRAGLPHPRSPSRLPARR